MTTQPEYKPLAYFYIATISLLLTGILYDPHPEALQIAILLWSCICGVVIVYRFNDILDHPRILKFRTAYLFQNKLNTIFIIQFLLITLPAGFIFLSPLRLILMLAICGTGIIYSSNFRINTKNYRLKKLFLFKNIMIGAAWGAIVAVGANSISFEMIGAIYFFTAIQVMIGSMIRDIPDIEQDKLHQVQTLPSKLGITKSIALLHFLNLTSLIVGYCLNHSKGFLCMMLAVVAWRLFTLLKVNRYPTLKWWTHTINLLTCVLIFTGTLVQYLYELYQPD